MKPSKAWSWNKADTQKFLKEALRFLAPYLIVIIPVVIGELPKDWAYATIVIWILNRIVSFLTILAAGK